DGQQAVTRERPNRRQTRRNPERLAQSARQEHVLGGIDGERGEQEPMRNARRRREQPYRQRAKHVPPPASRTRQKEGAQENRVREPEGRSTDLGELHADAIGQIEAELEAQPGSKLSPVRPALGLHWMEVAENAAADWYALCNDAPSGGRHGM